MILRNGKVQDKNLKVSKINICSFYQTFCGKCEEEPLPKWFFIFNQLENCLNHYYTDNLSLKSSADVPLCIF